VKLRSSLGQYVILRLIGQSVAQIGNGAVQIALVKPHLAPIGKSHRIVAVFLEQGVDLGYLGVDLLVGGHSGNGLGDHVSLVEEQITRNIALGRWASGVDLSSVQVNPAYLAAVPLLEGQVVMMSAGNAQSGRNARLHLPELFFAVGQAQGADAV